MKDRAGQTRVFEQYPIVRAVLALAVPTVVSQIILVIYNMADTFFIGLAGSDAMITAVTVCMPAFMFLSAISNLFGVGGASAIARALGAGDGAGPAHADQVRDGREEQEGGQPPRHGGAPGDAPGQADEVGVRHVLDHQYDLADDGGHGQREHRP
ncbi:MAG: hypothetical protein IJH09_12450, partial [Clostridia bacterium]|nr:hypothetical protein [Clostridia bacterium]